MSDPREPSAAATQAVLLLAMLIWGLNVTAVKLLTGELSPLRVASLRMGVACIVLTAVLLWWRRLPRRLTGRQMAGLLVCGLLMVYANQILLTQGLLRSTATNAALIMALSPLVSALLAAVAFHERLTAPRLAGLALGFLGVAAVILSHPLHSLSAAGAGDLLLVGAVISFAAGGALVQRLAGRLDALAISWAVYLIGTALLIVHDLATAPVPGFGDFAVGWRTWGLVLFSGVFATALSSIAWNQAIGRIGVARTAVFFYWVPVFGVLGAVVLLGERLTAWHLVGFVAVMLGTWLGTQRARDAHARA
ncbi:DMT family transporter [Hydrogenophaga sp.]|uniref:DMT family transporter n=1 Tax=Hydrogenophaga sp. TaxID=1904254 RepID=UPI00263772DA|nr:DMT family transporter [Hydrogenophaga sp.]MCW5652832.1 DMT family transporter [Hydrogenophaga sp.]